MGMSRDMSHGGRVPARHRPGMARPGGTRRPPSPVGR